MHKARWDHSPREGWCSSSGSSHCRTRATCARRHAHACSTHTTKGATDGRGVATQEPESIMSQHQSREAHVWVDGRGERTARSQCAPTPGLLSTQDAHDILPLATQSKRRTAHALTHTGTCRPHSCMHHKGWGRRGGTAAKKDSTAWSKRERTSTQAAHDSSGHVHNMDSTSGRDG